MPDGQLLSVNTSSIRKSIWRDIDRDRFRRNIVALQRASNQVPCDPKVHTRNEWRNPRISHDDPSYTLPFEVEQRLADDFAYIAAAEEGVKAVSAVALEESLDPAGLTMRLAANESVPERVPHIFKKIFNLLGRCARRKMLLKPCAEKIFEHVVDLSQKRLFGRLQSRQWIRPRHLSRTQSKPLHQELRKASRELFKGPLSTHTDFSSLMKKLDGLCESYELVDKEWENTEQGFQMLKEIVRKSYDFCTSGDTCSTLEETIHSLGLNPSPICADKRIHQVQKIGRYWELSVHLTKCSKKYDKVFKDLNLQILQPYQRIESAVSSTGLRVSCFVHAEIQLVTFYGLNANSAIRRPRVLGASKKACYLCNLFVLIQGHYFVTKTHGHLYDQWNVPDLVSFKPEQLADYRRVLSDMNKKVEQDLAAAQSGWYGRRHPMTSSVNLPTGQTISPLLSDVGTIISNDSSNLDPGLTLPPIRSLASPNEQQDSSIPLAESPVLYDEPLPAPKHSSSQPRATEASFTNSNTSALNEYPAGPSTKMPRSSTHDSETPTASAKPPGDSAQPMTLPQQFSSPSAAPKSSSASSNESGPWTASVKSPGDTAQPMTPPQQYSSPSAVPKSSSSSSNESGSSTPSPMIPKTIPRTRTSKHASSSTAQESSRSSSTDLRPSTPPVEPPILNLQPETSYPLSPPQNPNSSHSATPAIMASHSAQPMTSPQQYSSPSAVPKSSSSSSNVSGPSAPSPIVPKKTPRTRTSKHASSSTAQESSRSSSTDLRPSTPPVEPPILNLQPTASHPSSPPHNSNSSHPILANHSTKPAVMASHTRLPNSPVHSSTKNSRLLSSTTIASEQLPALRDISRESPIRVSTGQMSTEIEFEGPGHGKVLMQHIENPGIAATGTFVDVEELLPNESLVLERAEISDQLALVLHYKGRSLGLDLRWH
ncbi:hypothetical protein MMC07_003408 [Pseudocyphellaria aurata]|nr:hypothetical protein [Pseudocyphellaria aurata]